MALLPIDNCTAPIYGAQDRLCTRNISSSYHTYPSFWTCPDDSNDDRQFCYVVANHADANESLDLVSTLTGCCDTGVGGQGFPCINWCPYQQSLESLNACLGSKGLAPSYNDTGVVRDTYCVPSLKQQDNGKNVTEVNTLSSAAARTRSLGRSGGVKSGLLVGAVVIGACWLA